MSTLSRQHILGFAVLMAALTTFVAYRMLFFRASALTVGGSSTVTTGPEWIAVANRDIQPLQLLDRGMFRLVPSAGRSTKEALTALEQIDGQIATGFIAKDKPVTSADVAYPDASFGMTFQVPSGSRAMAVPVTPVSGVAGFLKPGNHVDVLATFRKAGGGEAVTRTVAQDVVLLAYGHEIRPAASEGEESGKKEKKSESESQPADTATLLLSPVQAEPLAMAASEAKLSLALRGIKEETPLARVSGVWQHEITDTAADRHAASHPTAAPPAPNPAVQTAALPAPVAPRVSEKQPEPATRPIFIYRGTRAEVVQVPR
jgi:pilus assembly protein CpaB